MWLENPIEIFCSTNIVPMTDMRIEEQMNSLTRLVIVISLILFLFGFKYSLLFLLLSLLFIIIIYYIQKKQMEQFSAEHYKPQPQYKSQRAAKYIRQNASKGVEISRKGTADPLTASTYRFCDDDELLKYNDPNYVSANQRLAGGPNPKTLVAPVIAPKSHSIDYWRANNLVTHSAINSETQQEAYQDGFQVSTCCGSGDLFLIPENSQPRTKFRVKEEYSQPHQTREDFATYSYPYQRTTQPDVVTMNGKYSGDVNTSCGYNPQQIYTSGLPSNYTSGNCEKDPKFKRYNENLFTQTIEPGVYTRSQVNDPINANIGISFTQQLEPTTCQNTDEGLMYTEHDPRIIEPIHEDDDYFENVVNASNVYDPRHSGYGTSYRSYTDKNIGQTRFMYDDVDAIRMPNYLVRSQIDAQPYADSYGPIQAGNEFGNKYNENIRALANDSFLRSTIEQRTGLQQSLMRKRNNEMWQRRAAPINTGSQRMLGGMGLGAVGN